MKQAFIDGYLIVDLSAKVKAIQVHETRREYMPISPQALELCGQPRKPNQLVFEDLPDPSWISRPLKKWLYIPPDAVSVLIHTI